MLYVFLINVHLKNTKLMKLNLCKQSFDFAKEKNMNFLAMYPKMM